MLETERLVLRQWKESDYLPFIHMGFDSEVMKYFPNCLTQQDSLNFIKAVTGMIDENKWGFWAVELKDSQEFIGFIGLHSQPTQFDFSPCVEIGWRLAKDFWGQGYATEGAKAALEYAFNTLNLDKVVSFTASVNKPSESVMKKLGMIKVKEFNHPKLPPNHYLEKHILYEIYRPI
ncbi:GNAT family N-acetyltransferase [Acinetobacter sp. ANC 4648]|uniref:GNAT family N-acetyltransferase n=1 Tax=Acinetobacter sp. ANC 4648 TaxID=1977875 RepID=UPI000A352BE0|nr:GNAT family N-acetyltransferase [Acinetobacter sp. ANC 4648]OTG81626.1 GNAT family N-acetyltransferase [Acinetobacter sp. ANC 4648]